MKKNFLLFLALATFLAFSFKVVHRKLSEPKEQSQSKDPAEQAYLNKKAEELKEKVQTKQNFCENFYFPIVSGANWKYDFYSGDTEEILEITVPESETESKIVNIYSTETGDSFQSKIFCSSEGITADSLFFLNLPSEMPATIEIKNSLGFFLPKDLEKTTSWNFELETTQKAKTAMEDEENEENITPQQTTATLEKKIKISFNAVGEEEIETSFGKIKTHRIDSWWLIEENLSREEAVDEEIKVSRATCSFWLAEQTGIVKSVYEEKNKKIATWELRSFQIPAIR